MHCLVASGADPNSVTSQSRDRRLSDVVLPGVAALGGMVMPALVYLAFSAWGEARGCPSRPTESTGQVA